MAVVRLVRTILERQCSHCLELLPLFKFGYHKAGWQQRRSVCKVCNEIKRYTYKKKNKEKVIQTKMNGNLRRNYGFSEKQYNEMLINQGSRCAICRSFPKITKTCHRLSVDHCHVTKNIRGLLCNSCNLGLGKFKDNPDLIEQALLYLRKNP
jgi:hypothetical protein